MIFHIKKGSHYSNNLIYKLVSWINTSDRVSNYVTFDETAIYNDDTLDKFDVNKLFGFSLGLHHKNSHRFGWNCIDGKIHIYAYSYINGKRMIKEICIVEPNQTYNFVIKIKDGKCLFTVIDSDYQINQVFFEITNKMIFGYQLWPYFGGNKVAPQNISIDMDEFLK